MHTYAYDVYSLFSYTSHDNLLDLEKLRDMMRRGKKSHLYSERPTRWNFPPHPSPSVVRMCIAHGAHGLTGGCWSPGTGDHVPSVSS